MNAPAAERLRELVTDYYHGLLTFESYREQRGRLLDSLGSAETPEAAESDDDTQTRKRLQPEFTPEAVAAIERQLGATEPAQSRDIEEPETLTVPSSGAGKWITLAAVVVIVGGGAAWLLLQGGTAPPVTPETGRAAGVPVTASTPAEALIEQFLARADWSGASIGGFVGQWAALDAAEQATARETAAFRRLNDVLQQRVREEEALSGAAASPALLGLLALAEDLQFAFAANLRDRLGLGNVPATAPATAPLPVPAVPAPNPATESVAAPAAAPPTSDAAAAGPAPAIAAADSRPEPVTAPPAQQPSPAPATSTARAMPAPAATTAAATNPAPAQATDAVPQDLADPAAAAGNDPCRAELAATRRPYCQDALASGLAGPALVVLPAGQFVMGSDAAPAEGPMRPVTIAAGFAMSLYEISVGEFRAFCEAASYPCVDADWGDDDDPVVGVSWHDAVAYVEWLSSATGQTYALPSEAEWEYAARAGTDTPYFFGDEITPSAAHSLVNGNVTGPAGRGDSAVNRNGFRLLHMAGNVREWVADPWHDDHSGAPADGSVRAGGDADLRVVRGGSFSDPADRLRSAARESLPPGQRDAFTGIRVVRRLAR